MFYPLNIARSHKEVEDSIPFWNGNKEYSFLSILIKIKMQIGESILVNN